MLLSLLGIKNRNILFLSNERKQWFFFSAFTAGSIVARSRKNEVIFFLCVGENQAHISKCIPCPKWHSAHSYLHIAIDSMEPFVSKMHRLFQLCLELGFVCYCPLGAKKTPKMLSNTITNRMAWRRIQNLWAKAVFSLWPLDFSGSCFKCLHFYLKKETASVTHQLAHFQGVTHRVHKHWVTGWSTL